MADQNDIIGSPGKSNFSCYIWYKNRLSCTISGHLRERIWSMRRVRHNLLSVKRSGGLWVLPHNVTGLWLHATFVYYCCLTVLIFMASSNCQASLCIARLVVNRSSKGSKQILVNFLWIIENRFSIELTEKFLLIWYRALLKNDQMQHCPKEHT